MNTTKQRYDWATTPDLPAGYMLQQTSVRTNLQMMQASRYGWVYLHSYNYWSGSDAPHHWTHVWVRYVGGANPGFVKQVSAGASYVLDLNRNLMWSSERPDAPNWCGRTVYLLAQLLRASTTNHPRVVRLIPAPSIPEPLARRMPAPIIPKLP